MDGIKLDGHTGTLWLCKRECGHALGLLVRVHSNGLTIDRLLLFREAVKVESFADAKIFGAVEGTMMDIECSICKSKRTWWMGAAALERFMQNRKSRVEKEII